MEIDNREFAFRFNKFLADRGLTLVCAESMTAGLLASTLASAPGTMAVFEGSVVTYSPAMKEQLLEVPRSILETYTAESQETTNAMLKGLKILFPNTSIHVAVTGIASVGPNGLKGKQTPGQIYVAIAIEGQNYSIETIVSPAITDEWGNNIRHATVRYILEQVWRRIENNVS